VNFDIEMNLQRNCTLSMKYFVSKHYKQDDCRSEALPDNLGTRKHLIIIIIIIIII